MKPTNWIIPMAGKGTRTSTLGAFKPFIKVGEKRVLEWLLLSLACHFKTNDVIHFITTIAFEEEFDVRGNLKKIFDEMGLLIPANIILAEDTPPGPAASVHLTKNSEMADGPVIIVNVDQYIQFQIPEAIYNHECGFLPIYAEFGTKSSYAEIVDGNIIRVVEKNNISNLASGGVYGFSSAALMFHAIEKQFASGLTTNGEFYVGPAYNFLIQENIPVYPSQIMAKFDLGSVDGIMEFKKRMLANA